MPLSFIRAPYLVKNAYLQLHLPCLASTIRLSEKSLTMCFPGRRACEVVTR